VGELSNEGEQEGTTKRQIARTNAWEAERRRPSNKCLVACCGENRAID
jgi:hypothetical protein